MGARHTHTLHRPGDSVVHRMPAHVKIVVAFLMVLAVVATPREAFAVFGLHLLLLVGVWVAARIPPGWLAARALIEAPFVVLAVLLPFFAAGPRVEWWGMSLSADGLLAGWNILVKGTLGVLVSITLAATTPLRDLVSGLARLRVPSMICVIATLMLRYLEVIVAEARRMRLARISRGHDPRFLWQAGATARGVGALFIRSYERGERVHLAMLSRGYTGRLPTGPVAVVGGRAWATALSLPLAAAAVLAAGSLLG
mgnify:CR=1 FL=1